MENIRRHLPFSFIKNPVSPQSRSQFHLGLPDTLQFHVEESIHLLDTYSDAVDKLCEAGSHLADKLNVILKGSVYTDIAGQFFNFWKELCDTTVLTSSQIIEETEMQLRRLHESLGVGERNNTSPENMKVVGTCLASIIQVQSQLFQSAGQALSSIGQYHLLRDLNQRGRTEKNGNHENSENIHFCMKKNERRIAESANKSVDGLREHFTSLFSKLTQKAPTSQSRFYVNFDNDEAGLSENDFKEEFENTEVAVCSLSPDVGCSSVEDDKTVLKVDHLINQEPTFKKAIPTSDELQDILTLLSCGPGKYNADFGNLTYQIPVFPSTSFSYGQWQSNQSEYLSTLYYSSKQNYIGKDFLTGADHPRQVCNNSWGWPHSIQTFNLKTRSSSFNCYEQSCDTQASSLPRQICESAAENTGQEFNSNWSDNSQNCKSICDDQNWNSGQDSSSSSDEVSSNNGHDTESVFSMGLQLTGNDLVASVNQRRRHSSSDCLASFDELINPAQRKRSFGDLSSGSNKNKTSTWPLKQVLAKSLSLCNSNQLHLYGDQVQSSLVGCHFGTASVWTMQEPSHLPPSGADNRNQYKIERKYPYFSQLAQN